MADTIPSESTPVKIDIEELSEELWEELEPVISRNAELAGRDDVQVNRELYELIARSGNLYIVTARHEGRLVGYFVLLLYDNQQTSRKEAQNDTFFIEPAYRKGNVKSMFALAISLAKGLGAKSFRFETPTDNSLKGLMEWAGLAHTCNVYRGDL